MVLLALVTIALHATICGSFRLPAQRISTRSQGSLRMSVVAESKLEQIVTPSRTETTQYVFVGGKGGVGKTSTSSAIALALSDRNFKTLVVSTDPAHSLGDALDVDLSSGKLTRIESEENLWALEIDVDEALLEFKNTADNLDPIALSANLGVPADLIESFGLSDLTSVFTNPPPGIDEIIGLLKIFEYANNKDTETPKFDRIVIDTAPTGHTLRLLQLPEFLNSVTGKLIKFKSKVNGAINALKGFFGSPSGGQESSAPTADNIMDKLESLQRRMSAMKSTFTNQKQTQFVIVTIPTSLAVAESERLLNSLTGEGIKVSGIICNQILAEDVGAKYVATRRNSQLECIRTLVGRANALDSTNVEITQVPYVDYEVLGVHALRFFSQFAHKVAADKATNPIFSRKLTIFGGKGGVGKTTSSASWAVTLCDAGLKTLVVSTDPAHSLGDSLQEQLKGTPTLIDNPQEHDGELWAMEIDPKEALEEFQSTIKSALKNSESSDEEKAGSKSGGIMGSLGVPDLRGEMFDLVSGVDDPPPGTDEIVALTKIISYMENGYTTENGDVIKFDRIVLDTAPTGHTLRMLELPGFLLQLLTRFKKVRDKMDPSKSMGENKAGEHDAIDESSSEQSQGDAVSQFQARMEKLQSMIHDEKEAEFTVVTIPTVVATSETCRLLVSLEDSNIATRRLIVNQVIPSYSDDDTLASDSDVIGKAYIGRLRESQSASLNRLQQLPGSASLDIIKVPYFDTEVRSVNGLRAISNELFPRRDTDH